MNPAVSGGSTLKLQTNVPEVIALEFSEGRAVQSQFGGDQVMYSLTDGRRMYVSPFVADKIRHAGITAGVPFEMCKREVARGNQRSVEYQIRTINDVSGGAAAETAPHHPIPTATTQQPNHTARLQVAASAAVPAVIPAAVPPAAEPTTIAVLKRAGVAAVDAVLEVESYARSRGMVDFAFGAKNLQKVWLALYIDARKTGGRA
jgi:hypothetical protein